MTQGLYFHIPFCISKCPYCDFLSYPIYQHMHHRASLLCAMKKNVLLWKDNTDAVDSVYFGGGTPSLLDPEELKDLIDSARASLNCKSDCEITIEANPGTVNREYFSAIKDIGVNRVSIGVQSFDDMTLKAIGRIHASRQAIAAVEDAFSAGIDNVSIDLMAGLPGQTTDEMIRNASTAVSLGVEHISCYDLTIAEGTVFGKRFEKNELNLPDENALIEARTAIDAILENAGFERYEISNYAKEGYRCRHNLHYWHNEPYIGIGPAAVGRFKDFRYQNAASIDKYIDEISDRKKWHEIAEQMDDYDDAFDSLMLGTRLSEGIDCEKVLRGLEPEERERWRGLFAKLTENGFAVLSGGRLMPTKDGWNVQNNWLMDFLKNHDKGLTI